MKFQSNKGLFWGRKDTSKNKSDFLKSKNGLSTVIPSQIIIVCKKSVVNLSSEKICKFFFPFPPRVLYSPTERKGSRLEA